MTQICEAFGILADLALSMGVERINELPGCWECQIDKRWFVAMNGRAEPVKLSTGEKVDPFHCYVKYNGWPAGIFTPGGGTIAAGEGANEDAFIDAMKARIVKETA